MKLKDFILFSLTLGYCYAKKFDRVRCGKSLHPQSMILDGTEVTEGVYPWMASVRGIKTILAEYCKGGNICCGGSILSERWVLTAAHCVIRHCVIGNCPKFPIEVMCGGKGGSDSDLYDIEVYYGLLYFDNRDGGQMVKALDVITHDEFKRDYNYDIALIKTASPMKFGKKVGSICLPKSLKDIPTGKAYFAGWGYTSIFDDYGEIATKLMKATVNILHNKKCTKRSEVSLCVQGQCGSVCYGDSGGPLFQFDESGKAIIIGIASRLSEADCRPGSPVAFTRVSAFLNWIIGASG